MKIGLIALLYFFGSAIQLSYGQENEIRIKKYNEVDEVKLTDLVLIAKLHTYLGQKLLKPIPRINLVPSFVKLQVEAQLSPENSLQFIADAKQKISETRRALGG